jgi:hypothetical protein
MTPIETTITEDEKREKATSFQLPAASIKHQARQRLSAYLKPET